MLGGEDFRGRHESGLVPVFYGYERGLHGDDGLAGADIALEEAAHGLGGLRMSCDDLREDALLGGGGVEGEDLLEGFTDLGAGDGEEWCRRGLACG